MTRAIVLAAGKGTRMKSSHPKVLHELCGRPLLWYVIAELRNAGIQEIVVVTNPDLQAQMGDFDVQSVVQTEQLGTGHAVRIGLDALAPSPGARVVVASGDMPLVPGELFSNAIAALAPSVALVLVTARMPLPSSFGRIIRDTGSIQRIVETRDCTADQLLIDEMNAGVYAFDENALRRVLPKLDNNNAQGEYYLTDTVDHFVREGSSVLPLLVDDHRHVLGINDRTELAHARAEMNARLCRDQMLSGVTIIDPATTYLEPELRIGRDTVIYPNTHISRLSEIGMSCVIGPNTRLSNAVLANDVTVRESIIIDSRVGDDATIGPYAHIRGGAVLADQVRVGNFVEIKKSHLDTGVKASHLSYLGDATIGENSNIGAGTITCNYDGEHKHETRIGKNVRIGSNTSIIAPRTIGDDAITGASSVVTHDVAPAQRVAGNPARPLPKR